VTTVSGTIQAQSTPATSRLADYAAMSKLRMTAMVAAAAAVGFYLGHKGPMTFAATPLLLITIFGTALVAIGSGVVNQVMERKHDARMPRTSDRPIATGRVGVPEALAFAGVVTATGLIVLAFGANVVSAAAASAAWLSYVAAYTPLKRVTPLSVFVGAIPGALPAVIGWTAARATIGVDALLLFGIIFAWQIPHFMAIGWLYRKQYAGAGFRVLPAVEPTGRRTMRYVVIGCLALIPFSLLPTIMGLFGAIYYVGVMAIGFAFLVFGLEMARLRTPAAARQLLLASLVYLPTLFLLMTIDKTVV
jgi:protoheme IX farnesyltransferase